MKFRKALMTFAVAAVVCGCSGNLEIHHLSTGRGNCTYIVMPDGTTMMIDCGDDPVSGAIEHNEMQPMMPDGLHSTAENIAEYIAGVAPQGKENVLDYFLLTHFHSDHVFAFDGIAQLMQINTVVDRSYPDYPEEGACDIDEYRQVVSSLINEGKSKAECFRVGAADQFAEKNHKGAGPEIEIRNLCANGYCWTGEGEEMRKIYEPNPNDENQNSCGIRLRWGKFNYLSCGDVPGGYLSPDDMQTALAGVCGRCNVFYACHHAYQDSMIETLVKAVDTQAYVVPTREYWHPSGLSVENMCNPALHSGSPMIYCTGLLESQKDNFREMGVLDHFAPAGHVVIKVGGRGNWFRIFVLDASERDHPVLFKSRKIKC